MTRFSLDAAVAETYPQSQVRFVVAHGLRNDRPWTGSPARPQSLEWLELAEAAVAAGVWQPFDQLHPAIASWHDAYRAFGVNPKRLRPSVDALGRRLVRQGRLPRINSAVDTYNLVSVAFGVPAGAFDLAAIDGPVTIRFARPGDRFTPLGEPDVAEEPEPGEVVYARGTRILTRCWNHRDADQTKVTTATRDAVFILERVSAAAVPDARLAEAQRVLAEFVAPHAGDVSGHTLEPAAPGIDLRPGTASTSPVSRA